MNETASTQSGRTKPSSILKKAAFSVTVLVVVMLLADRVAGWLLPIQEPPQVAHPADFSQQRSNLEFQVTFGTNSQGLRSAELDLQPEENEFRIAFAGDSFTEGHGVEVEQTYPSVLETLAIADQKSWRSVNCGISGAGPLRYCRTLCCVGLRYRPRLVVFAVHTNDVTDTTLEDKLELERVRPFYYEPKLEELKWQPGTPFRRFVYSALPWTYTRLQRLKSQRQQKQLLEQSVIEQLRTLGKRRGVAADDVESRIARIPQEVLAACDEGRFNVQLLSSAVTEPEKHAVALELKTDTGRERFKRMMSVFDTSLSICKSEQIGVLMIYIPSPFQYDETIGTVERAIGMTIKQSWLTETVELEKQLQRWCDDRQLPYLSLVKTFRKAAAESKGKWNYPMDGHWTAAGHRLAAEAIYGKIQEIVD